MRMCWDLVPPPFLDRFSHALLSCFITKGQYYRVLDSKITTAQNTKTLPIPNCNASPFTWCLHFTLECCLPRCLVNPLLLTDRSQWESVNLELLQKGGLKFQHQDPLRLGPVTGHMNPADLRSRGKQVLSSWFCKHQEIKLRTKRG